LTPIIQKKDQKVDNFCNIPVIVALFFENKKPQNLLFYMALGLFVLEAPPRFELGNKGFADLCLTTWLWRHFYLHFIV
jgi:hypothetical protein